MWGLPPPHPTSDGAHFFKECVILITQQTFCQHKCKQGLSERGCPKMAAGLLSTDFIVLFCILVFLYIRIYSYTYIVISLCLYSFISLYLFLCFRFFCLSSTFSLIRHGHHWLFTLQSYCDIDRLQAPGEVSLQPNEFFGSLPKSQILAFHKIHTAIACLSVMNLSHYFLHVKRLGDDGYAGMTKKNLGRTKRKSP